MRTTSPLSRNPLYADTADNSLRKNTIKKRNSIPDRVDLLRDIKTLSALKRRFLSQNSWATQAIEDAVYVMEKEIVRLKHDQNQQT
jgi:hypothetical protein